MIPADTPQLAAGQLIEKQPVWPTAEGAPNGAGFEKTDNFANPTRPGFCQVAVGKVQDGFFRHLSGTRAGLPAVGWGASPAPVSRGAAGRICFDIC